MPHAPSSPTLYTHITHPHRPRNANDIHQEEHLAKSLNQHIAVALTRLVGTMPTAYLFVLLAAIGLAGILGFLPTVAILLVAWFSQTFLQLVLLPILAVSQNVLSRKQEITADEQFAAVIKSEHEITQMIRHLDAQDAELLRQSAELGLIKQELFDHKAIMMQFLTRVEKHSGSGKILGIDATLVAPASTTPKTLRGSKTRNMDGAGKT